MLKTQLNFAGYTGLDAEDYNLIALFYDDKAQLFIQSRDLGNIASISDFVTSKKSALIEKYGREHNIVFDSAPEGKRRGGDNDAYILQFVYTDNGVSVKERIWYLNNGYQIFAISLATNSADFNNYLQKGEQAVKSFRLT